MNAQVTQPRNQKHCLQRIILASSNPGDMVADFFCGSGTTPLVAAKNGRKFITSDIAIRAVHTARSRLAENTVCLFHLSMILLRPLQFQLKQRINQSSCL